MKFIKVLLLIIVIVLIAIQFLRPARNKNGLVSATDISRTVSIPDSVQTILRNACYDCHSNSTDYPWYSNIQPVGWILARHIKHGRQHLNFSEFGTYPVNKQANKLSEVAELVEGNYMPLPSYARIHRKARLSSADKDLLVRWAEMAAKTPR